MNERNRDPERPRVPPDNDSADGSSELLRAPHDGLARKPAAAIALREITVAAGRSPEMIRYHFVGQDALVAASIDASWSRVRTSLDKLRRPPDEARTGCSRLVLACLRISFLKRRGIHRRSLDTVRTATLIVSVTGCPVRLLDRLSPVWASGSDCATDAVAAVIDAF